MAGLILKPGVYHFIGGPLAGQFRAYEDVPPVEEVVGCEVAEDGTLTYFSEYYVLTALPEEYHSLYGRQAYVYDKNRKRWHQ